MTPGSRPTSDDVRRWVSEDFGVHAVVVDEVTGGTDTSAAVWRVIDGEGTAWAAKWTTRPSRTGTRLVSSMAAAGLEGTPGTRTTADGRRRSRRAGGKLALTRWSDGEDAATVGLGLEAWRAYGALLADVHAHAFPVPPRRQGARRGIRRRRRRYRAEIRALDAAADLAGRSAVADADADADAGAAAGAAQATAAAAARSADPVLDLWRDARDRVDLLLRGTRLEPGAAGDPVPCHGDPHLGNVLVESDGSLRLVDWDEAVVGPREIDLHLVEFSVLFTPATPEQLAAFRAGYGPVELDERRLVRYACIRALEDLTSTMTAALTSTGADRDEALRVVTGILAPAGSASLVEPRLRQALDLQGI
ncbi:aminoglycoside phosphotransferase family protein [Curtobacterium sp. RHCJP20]|uniref:Aminoglycoside phosphotransferase family protein n=1 Tax=Curtobacterium subtropicum TaxID=3055138 RepID=A0ABT7TG00_9MICO|nr:aminoglycoside phosphotransferase family protein [Curtobacterium subtropicum]MDM7888508.1 aminoglycoside phosphotransferase family protein [Curtobacterium subtropicum]